MMHFHPEKKHLFGPVPSRRLGLSLGIDLIPYKTCTLNCIYCECGCTTRQTLQRQTFFPVKAIITELKDELQKHPDLDYITLGGSGEPTLYKKTGSLIKKIKKITSIPVAVLTNGTLLYKSSVRRSVIKADLVIPSLDSAVLSSFKKIDRPHPDLELNRIISGLVRFRKEFKGAYWLEIFFIKKVNNSDKDLKALIQTIKQIQPDKVQLNTIDRPPAEKKIKPLNEKALKKIQLLFSKEGIKNTEIIKSFKKKNTKNFLTPSELEQKIINIIRRRPETANHLGQILGFPLQEIQKCLSVLKSKNLLTHIKNPQGKTYYCLKK